MLTTNASSLKLLTGRAAHTLVMWPTEGTISFPRERGRGEWLQTAWAEAKSTWPSPHGTQREAGLEPGLVLPGSLTGPFLTSE